jgi:hypothetical protein
VARPRPWVVAWQDGEVSPGRDPSPPPPLSLNPLAMSLSLSLSLSLPYRVGVPPVCRRVIATLHKGASLDVVIAGGEDISDEDFDGLAAALKAQGITGVARIKVVGLVEPE